MAKSSAENGNLERGIAQGTHHSRPENDLVVFLIGARINRWWKIGSWWPVARAFGEMMQELEENHDLGFLSAEQWVGRTTIAVQYWRSKEQLLAYAKSRESKHLPAWQAFNKRVRKHPGDVGLWHEMYTITPAAAHSTYVDMPRFGLTRAILAQSI